MIRKSNYVSGAREETIELVEWSERRVPIRARQSPLHFDKPETCLANTTKEKTVTEELNFKLTYKIGKSIRDGAADGEHIIEVKTC